MRHVTVGDISLHGDCPIRGVPGKLLNIEVVDNDEALSLQEFIPFELGLRDDRYTTARYSILLFAIDSE